jgi:hypothetical protein
VPFTANATLYGNVNYDVTLEGDAHAWEGKLGLKLSCRG